MKLRLFGTNASKWERLSATFVLLWLLLFAGPLLGQMQYQSTGTKASLRGLSVVSKNVVWASGTGGTYLRTIDGGQTWRSAVVTGAEDLDFRGIKAFDSDHCVLVSSGLAQEGRARIYRTDDGGQHWSLAYSSAKKGVFFDAVAFWDRNHGIAISDPVDGRFVLIATDDGGATWHELQANMPAALPNDGAFAASNSSFAVRGNSEIWLGTGGASVARIFHSSNRGRTWTAVDVAVQAGTPSTGIFSVAFRNERNGVVVGGDYTKTKQATRNIAITHDGGRTWKLAEGGEQSRLFLSSVAYVNTNELIATGPAGWARSNDGGLHWTERQGDGFNAVAVDPSGKTAWAVGANGRVARIDVTRLFPAP